MTSATRSGDNPARFRSSRVVGAHFGLTPRKHQSGETDVTGRISRIGDHGVRVALYEAANVILTRAVTGSDLKSWALGVARRAGMRKAKVALARKLAVVLHRMLADGTTFMASNLHGQQGSPISGCGRLGSTGGNEGSGGLGTSPVRKQVPSRDDGSGQAAYAGAAVRRLRVLRLADRSSSDPIRQRPRADCGQKQDPGGLDHAHEGLTPQGPLQKARYRRPLFL